MLVVVCPVRCTLNQGTQLVSLNALDSDHSFTKWNQFRINIENLDMFSLKDDIRRLAIENETVCDSHGIEHTNLQAFYSATKDDKVNVTFSYFGKCLVSLLVSTEKRRSLVKLMKYCFAGLLFTLWTGLWTRRSGLPIRMCGTCQSCDD